MVNNKKPMKCILNYIASTEMAVSHSGEQLFTLFGMILTGAKKFVHADVVLFRARYL